MCSVHIGRNQTAWHSLTSLAAYSPPKLQAASVLQDFPLCWGHVKLITSCPFGYVGSSVLKPSPSRFQASLNPTNIFLSLWCCPSAKTCVQSFNVFCQIPLCLDQGWYTGPKVPGELACGWCHFSLCLLLSHWPPPRVSVVAKEVIAHIHLAEDDLGKSTLPSCD